MYKKKLLSLFIVMSMSMIAVVGCGSSNNATQPASEESGIFTPGTYEGSAQGFGGEITVTVELSKDEIVKVDAVGDAETPGIGSKAIEEIPVAVVEKQTTNVDAVSGATVTSDAVIEAINVALTDAGVDPASLAGK